MRFIDLCTGQAINGEGMTRIGESSSVYLAQLGVPVYSVINSTFIHDRVFGEKPKRSLLAPRWACELIADWPEIDHDGILPRIVRRVLDTGDTSLAMAACSVMRISGPDAVIRMLDGPLPELPE